ncbi:MAG: hypothetical protein FK734_02915 [Asgard group archaeon]|nr:hypothetical protein [Asgard group archaeon]
MYHSSYRAIPKRIKTSANDNLNYLLRNGTDQQINFVFHLNGLINPEIMKKAVRMSMDAEPVLGCKLTITRKKTYWDRRNDLDHLDYFELINTDNSERDIRDFILTQINPSIDSLLKIRIFRGETDTLVIKSDHSVMDGGGFYDYLTLLCDIYNNLIDNPNYEITPNIQSSRELKQVFKHYTLRKKIRSLVREKGYRPKWSFPFIGKGKEKKTFIVRKLEASDFDKIKAYGKERNASLNDMFLTAAFRALFTLVKPKSKKTMTLAVPTDLRVLLPDKKAETIANLVSTTFVNLKYNPHASFDDMLNDINKQMRKKKDIHLGLGYCFAMNNIFKLNYKTIEWLANRIYKMIYRSEKMHPIITNVGRIDSNKRNFGSIDVDDAYIITPVNWAPNFSMGISSYNKKITFSIGFCEDSYDSATIKTFLDLIIHELSNCNDNDD